MGKTLFFALVGFLIWTTSTLAETNEKSTGFLEERLLQDDGGNVLLCYDICIEQLDCIKAFEIVLSYEGDIDQVSFAPSEFLHEPLCVPPIIDKTRRTVVWAVTATQKTATTKDAGFLGRACFSGKQIPRQVFLESMKIADVDNRISNAQLGDIKGAGGNGNSEKVARSEYSSALNQNYPNPANPDTRIDFTVERKGRIEIAIYDIRGQLIRKLMDAMLDAGNYSVMWDGKNDGGLSIASGVYYCRYASEGSFINRKIVLVR